MRRFATETGRVEAFSDGVFAVIITIMVLELRPPGGTDLRSLSQIAAPLATYALSFVFIGIYWNNHHHLLRASRGVDGRAMWANLNLLFWLSLIPFSTAWLGRNPAAVVPTAVYCVLFFLDGLAYTILQQALVAVNGQGTPFAKAVERDVKGKISLALYLAAIATSFVATLGSDAILIVVAILWLVPDRRLEPLIGLDRGDV